MKNKALTIRQAGNKARKVLGAKASPTEVGRLAAVLMEASRTDLSRDPS